MTEKETTEILSMLFRAFPSLGSWFDKNREAIRPVWLKTLSRTHSEDALNVVEMLIRGEIDLPANYEFDRVAILIRRQSGLFADKRRNEIENDRMRRERFEYHQDAKTATNEFERFFPAWRELTVLGERQKNRKISREENDAKVVQVKRWYEKGGDVPSFMNQTQMERS